VIARQFLGPDGTRADTNTPTTAPEMAVAWLRCQINHRLSRHSAARAVRADPAAAPGQIPLGVRIVPADLLGALWLQLARAIEGDKQYRKCEYRDCGKWFEISKGGDTAGKRADAQYCEPRCRAGSHRQAAEADRARKLSLDGTAGNSRRNRARANARGRQALAPR